MKIKGEIRLAHNIVIIFPFFALLHIHDDALALDAYQIGQPLPLEEPALLGGQPLLGHDHLPRWGW
jgi:hypothetical protein